MVESKGIYTADNPLCIRDIIVEFTLHIDAKGSGMENLVELRLSNTVSLIRRSHGCNCIVNGCGILVVLGIELIYKDYTASDTGIGMDGDMQIRSPDVALGNAFFYCLTFQSSLHLKAAAFERFSAAAAIRLRCSCSSVFP